MDYKFESEIIDAYNPYLSIKWYNNSTILYKRDFHGDCNYYNCLEGRYAFDMKNFSGFIDDISMNMSSEIVLTKNKGVEESYVYDSETNKLIIHNEFSSDGEQEIYFDVNESLIKLLRKMQEKIQEYLDFMLSELEG